MKLLRTLLFAILASSAVVSRADPILTSWLTRNSGVLARVVQTTTSTVPTVNTTPVTTWPTAGITNNNTGGAAQSLPAYADVQRIRYTATDVYINSNGLASYTMGPFLSSNGTGLFGFWPLSQHYQVRITRNPAPAATKQKHPGGMIGMMVNGVGIYDLGDAFSFHQTANNPVVTGSDGTTTGDGIWSRDALAVEVSSFDTGFAHQPGNNGQHHYHASPKALRFQLGDNVKIDPAATKVSNTYVEDTSNLHHSPILGWSFDGYPIYGPYGYSSPNDPNSPVTKMRSGFVLRNGLNGTQNLAVTGRRSLPKWAVAAQSYTGGTLNATTGDYDLPATDYGPATNYVSGTGPTTTTYPLGRYTGDYDFLGDRGQTQGSAPAGTFDLDQYNGRNCVTPEFPGGTYAYFVTIDSSVNGTAFPHMLGKQYYGTPNGANAAAVPANATELFTGGPNIAESWTGAPSVASGNVTVTWSSVEGGTYKIEASNNLSNWTPLPDVTAAANATQTSTVESAAASSNPRRFYKVTRTALAAYEYWTNISYTSPNVSSAGAATRGTTTGISIAFATSPAPFAPAPGAATISSIAVNLSTGTLTLSGSSVARPVATGATATGVVIPANEPVGAKTMVVTYSNSTVVTLTGAIIVN